MSQKTPACRRWRRRISLLALGELEPPAEADLRVHLESCPGCRTRLLELQTLGAGLNSLGKALPAIEPPPALGQRWRSALAQSEAVPRDTGEECLIGAWVERLADWALPNPKWWPGLAVAWALILLLRISSPGAAAPTASTPDLRLDQIVSILQTTATQPTLRSTPPRPEGALRQTTPMRQGFGSRFDPPSFRPTAPVRLDLPSHNDPPQPKHIV